MFIFNVVPSFREHHPLDLCRALLRLLLSLGSFGYRILVIKVVADFGLRLRVFFSMVVLDEDKPWYRFGKAVCNSGVAEQAVWGCRDGEWKFALRLTHGAIV